MARRGDSLARTLDFGEETANARPIYGDRRAGLRLAQPDAVLRGPAKYHVLDRRRRRAQIAARRALDLLDEIEIVKERR